MIRITTLDYAIMGLLHQGAKTGYAIRLIFEQTALGSYSSSPGTIYPALKKLERTGHVQKKALKEGGKAQFFLLDKGLEVLHQWLKNDLSEEVIDKRMNEVLLKFAFMEELLDKEERLYFLEELSRYLQKSLDQLQLFHQTQGQNLALHGRLALENGIEGQKAHLRWAKYAYQAIKTST